MKPIKMVDLASLHSPIREELDASIKEVIDQSRFIFGPQVAEFEQQLAGYLGSGHVISCANGTDALLLAILALDLPPESEILIPSFNYVSAAEVAVLLGHRPVFVEVNPLTYTIDPNDCELNISGKTKVIVAVHLFGHCADIEALLSICRKNNLYLVEDNAQALGADFTFSDGSKRKAGAIGHIGTTSFFPTKTLGCMGDGGAVFTGDPALAARIRQTAFHGQSSKYHYESVGINSRLDTIQAAILMVKLRYLDEQNKRRKQIANQYTERLRTCDRLELPVTLPYSSHVYHQFTIQNKNRDQLIKDLNSAGIPTNVYYPFPLHTQTAYRNFRKSKAGLKITESLASSVLSLPMHPDLEQDQIEYITNKLVGGKCTETPSTKNDLNKI